MSQETAYELIKRVIPKDLKVISGKSEELRTNIIASLGERKSYIANALYYLNSAIEQDDLEEARVMFENIFYKDFEKDVRFNFLIPAVAMMLEQIPDIVMMDISDRYDLKVGAVDKHYLREFYEVAKEDISIIIFGETGTSKGLLARALHSMSNRRSKPWFSINCAAMPEDLLEAELFGVIPNYPGFHNKEELVPMLRGANGGTLFLDEIGKASLHVQAKMLKVIEEKKFKQLGKSEPEDIDIRFITAVQPTHIEKDEMLPDLRYRFYYPIYLPNLNDRLKVLPDMVLKNSVKQARKKLKSSENISLSEGAISHLLQLKYTGNYRELESILIRAIIKAKIAGRTEILTDDLWTVTSDSFQSSTNAFLQSLSMFAGTIEKEKLKDIFSYGQKMLVILLESRIEQIKRSGKDIKSVLLEEGLPKSQYTSFWRKIKRLTGKGINDF